MQQELLESDSEKGREKLKKDPLKSGKQIDIKVRLLQSLSTRICQKQVGLSIADSAHLLL